MKKGNIKLNYFVIALIAGLVSYIGGLLTSSGMEWYRTLVLPNFVPADWVFGVAWTIIFILTAISAIIVWNKGDRSDWKFVHSIRFYILNAVLNVTWSLVFFVMHWVGVAVWEAALLGLTVYLLIYMTWSISRIASLLLLPYALWVTFATFLTYSIFLLN